ncbi:GspH/FimT family pseudopilin [Pseudomonas sp. F1_0610]|uniref:GspH/FimT family pseudopilin n=1 Tax=Pseudomonas sp. F1_0610 TaxID=3114284 RepID=UPI0039C126F8
MTYSKPTLAFTLPELVISLSIIMLVVVLATSAISQLVANKQTTNSIARLQHSIWQARTLAVKHRQTIVLCPSVIENTCSTTTSWEQGWIVTDLNNSKVYWKERALPKTQKLTWRGFSKHISFQPDGLASISNGHFILCRSNNISYQATVNRQGRLKQISKRSTENC